ncbi:MAG: NAD(P)H-quinone oxidoreductase subunit J, chloroplastic [Verrucomicrobiae bacterium]|nr:NAD(P)H-quinone oxidoreductase subunit J, chloroplastic [Verrucomicrobiae bacterium]
MIEQLRETIAQAVPGVTLEIIQSTPAAQQPALLVDRDHAFATAKFLKENQQLDFCSCVTGVDYPKLGQIEVVYHLYSVAKKTGPVVLKVRAPRELEQCRVPSLTPLWRGCEFQEREAYDLFGVKFDGHPDLRRILMWDEFTDHPMRKDYVPPKDYEWEPTPHDDTLTRAVEVAGIIPPSAREELEKAKKK